MNSTLNSKAVWICNTDVESEWALADNIEMPNRGIRQVIFNYFEEILLSSIGPANIAILRKNPDSEFIDYLKSLGISLPKILVAGAEVEKPWLPTSQLVIQNPSLIRSLSDQASKRKITVLESFGVSNLIEQIARLSGLSIPYSGSKVSKSISRKSFSRNIAKKVGLHIPDGQVCYNLVNLTQVVKTVRSKGKGAPVVIKPELGASGRGQFIIREQQDIDRLDTMIDHGDLKIYGTPFVVEQWYPRSVTLSYEFHVDQNEHISKTIKLREALKDKDKRDYGYIYPAAAESNLLNEIQKAVNRLVMELREEHQYNGPVRCDALLLPDKRLFPVLELNARYSFFHFIDMIHEKLAPQYIGLFCWFFFRFSGHIRFNEFIEKNIGKELLFTPDRQEGVVVPVWGTVTATEDIEDLDDVFPLRRLFVLILAATKERAKKIALIIREKLERHNDTNF